MMEKRELKPGGVPWRSGDDQPIIEPEIIEPEIVESSSRSSRDRESNRDFGQSPFPLTSAKLEAIVRRIDETGQMQLGAFYQARLKEECSLLLPQPIYGFDDWRFADLLATWNRNFLFFQCRGIGEVLACLEMARQNYETMRRNDADHKK